MKWLVLANPCAGTGNSTRQWHRRLCAELGMPLDMVVTAGPGHATSIAKQARGYDGIIIVGGDGTVAEAIQGMDPATQRLAVMPAGHGNCLARDLGLGHHASALGALRSLRFRRIDLIDIELEYAHGGVEPRICASTIAVGYVADVASKGRRRFGALGRYAYALASLLVVPRSLGFTVALESRERQERRLTGVVINNTRHLANFSAFGAARVDDGLIDVMELSAGWLRQQLHNAAVLFGSRRFGPCRLRQVQREEWRLADAGRLMIDGEMIDGVRGIVVACRRAALDCLVATP